MANKFGLNFDGFLALAEKIDGLKNGALKTATDNALKATGEYVTAEVDKAVASSPYNFGRTGRTKQSIARNQPVVWEGTRANISAGFDLNNGGMPSIYLTYGTPHIKPDTKLKAATKGTGAHKKAIEAIQAAEFNKVLTEAMSND